MTDRDKLIELLDSFGVTYDKEGPNILIDPIHNKVIGENDIEFQFDTFGNFQQIDLSA